MLDGLDKIPWTRLRQVYGSAEEVPGLIRQLAIAKGDGMREGHPLMELFSDLHHQGTTYSSTPYAVPFLAELAEDRRTRCRSGILALLAVIADSAPSASARRARKRIDDEGKRWLRLLGDADPAVRAGAANLMASFPTRPKYRSALQRAAACEPDLNARAGMLLSLGRMRRPGPTAIRLLERVAMEESNRILRTAAAISLARLLGHKTPPGAAAFAVEALHSDWMDDVFNNIPWYVNLDRAELIARLGPTRVASAIERRLAGLASAKPRDAAGVFADLIPLAFRGVRRWRPRLGFSPEQHRILAELVKCDAAWKFANYFVGDLESLRLPGTRRKLAECSGVPAPHDPPPPLPRRRLRPSDVRVGTRVWHEKYGNGTVTRVRRYENETLADVKFDTEAPALFDLDRAVFFSGAKRRLQKAKRQVRRRANATKQGAAIRAEASKPARRR